MGLDMYAFTMKQEDVGDTLINHKDLFKVLEDDDPPRIDEFKVNAKFAYWRKFYPLHIYMEKRFIEYGGEGSFNCETVVFTREDLDILDKAVKEYKLLKSGILADDLYWEDDVYALPEFIEKAREAMDQGLVVIYDSWW